MNRHGKYSLSQAAFANTGEKRGVAPELQFGHLLISATEHLLVLPTPPPHSALSLPSMSTTMSSVMGHRLIQSLFL